MTRVQPPAADPRSHAFARLCEAVNEGVFIGVLRTAEVGDTTIAVNPHLKAIFGFQAVLADVDVAPFAPERFVDASARQAFLDRLIQEGGVRNHLLRLRRLDGSLIWVEVTANAAFYTVNEELFPPDVDPATWQLQIGG